MDIILTESQYIKLLVEKSENQIADVFINSKDIAKKIISDVKNQFGVDFTFLGTWGSVIGGFIGPISDYMNNKYPNLSETEITLICSGIILTFFSSNKEKLSKILNLIKERGIITFFDRALSKAYDLKEAFTGFIESLNVTASNISNMIAYAFLIPLTPLLKNVITLDLSQDQIEVLVTGITHYAGLSLGSKFVKNIVESMIDRFKSSDSDQEFDR